MRTTIVSPSTTSLTSGGPEAVALEQPKGDKVISVNMAKFT